MIYGLVLPGVFYRSIFDIYWLVNGSNFDIYWPVNQWTGQYPILAYTTWCDLNQSRPHISIRGITNIYMECFTTSFTRALCFSWSKPLQVPHTHLCSGSRSVCMCPTTIWNLLPHSVCQRKYFVIIWKHFQRHFYARQLYRQVLLRARISYGNSVRLSVCHDPVVYQAQVR